MQLSSNDLNLCWPIVEVLAYQILSFAHEINSNFSNLISNSCTSMTLFKLLVDPYDLIYQSYHLPVKLKFEVLSLSLGMSLHATIFFYSSDFFFLNFSFETSQNTQDSSQHWIPGLNTRDISAPCCFADRYVRKIYAVLFNAVFSENMCILGHAENLQIGSILVLEGCCVPLYLVEIPLYILEFHFNIFVLK